MYLIGSGMGVGFVLLACLSRGRREICSEESLYTCIKRAVFTKTLC